MPRKKASVNAALRRLSPRQRSKFKTVMREHKAGTLKSSSGDPVTDISQAVAIALSEARDAPRK